VRVWTSPWLHAAGICAIALVVFTQYGFYEHPLYGDRAIFVYQGQTILRGESVYAHSFIRYPPLAMLLQAAAMWIGREFGVPTYLAPRYAGLLIGVANPALLYLLTRRATNSAGAGFVAALGFASFAEYAGFSVANLEPKIVMISLTLGAGLALQGRRWGTVGCAAGLAGMCWQPAILVAFATVAVTWWGSRGERGRAVLRYGLGMALGLLPAVLYLALTDSWLDFWRRVIVIPASPVGEFAGTAPGFWLKVARIHFATDIGLFFTGGLGFLAFVLTSLQRSGKAAGREWLDPRLAALPLLTPMWASFSSFDFQGTPDMLPILPLLAFWTPWVANPWLHADAGPRRLAVWAVVGAAIAGYGFADAFLFEPRDTIGKQLRVVRSIYGPNGQNRVIAFDAHSVYALADRQGPLPYMQMNRYYMPFIETVEPEGCRGLHRHVLALEPHAVVVRQHRFQSRCVRRLQRILIGQGYEVKRATFHFQKHKRFTAKPKDAKRIDWMIYKRAKGGARPS
jgi:hypothetical protein